MMQTTINLLMFFTSVIVLAATLSAMNKMNAATNHWIRLSHALLSSAALAAILAPIAYPGWHPTPVCFLGMAGISILLTADARRSMRQDKSRSNIHVIHQHQHQQGRSG